MAKSSTSAGTCRITVRLPPELIEQIDETVLWMKKTPGIRQMGVKRSHALRYLLERGVLSLADHRAGKERKAGAAHVAREVREEENRRARERAEIERTRIQAELARAEAQLRGHTAALSSTRPHDRAPGAMAEGEDPSTTGAATVQRSYREIGERGTIGAPCARASQCRTVLAIADFHHARDFHGHPRGQSEWVTASTEAVSTGPHTPAYPVPAAPRDDRILRADSGPAYRPDRGRARLS